MPPKNAFNRQNGLAQFLSLFLGAPALFSKLLECAFQIRHKSPLS
jgi:hypothetical protein